MRCGGRSGYCRAAVAVERGFLGEFSRQIPVGLRLLDELVDIETSVEVIIYPQVGGKVKNLCHISLRCVYDMYYNVLRAFHVTHPYTTSHPGLPLADDSQPQHHSLASQVWQ